MTPAARMGRKSSRQTTLSGVCNDMTGSEQGQPDRLLARYRSGTRCPRRLGVIAQSNASCPIVKPDVVTKPGNWRSVRHTRGSRTIRNLAGDGMPLIEAHDLVQTFARTKRVEGRFSTLRMLVTL